MKKFFLLFLLISSLCFAVEPIDFSKSIAMSPAMLGLAGGKVAAESCDVVNIKDSSTTSDANRYFNNGELQWQAGSFTTESAYKICTFTVDVWKVGSPDPVVGSIRADNSNTPAASDLVTCDTVAVSATSQGEFSTTFSCTATSLSAGTKYWLVVKGTSSTAYFRWGNNAAGGCTNCMQQSSNGTSWTTTDNSQAAFKTYEYH